ncbi:hypothetical protein BKA70DRAFT_1449269 [Coprinopsis sp. MPI-PUGE-AT-0042]|nr:hypothetical protein BKA70DRAFT_1449269 [Coprinopsis sp. MPI-PUGE-AT-0042]
MTRGRNLATELEVSSATDQVRCVVCKDYAPTNSKWIKRKGWGKHQTTVTHRGALQAQDIAEQRQARARQRVVEDQHAASLDLSLLYGDGAGDDTPDPPLRRVTAGEEEMWRLYDTGQYALEMESPEKEMEKKLADFEQRVRQFNLSAESDPQDLLAQFDLEEGIAAQTEHDAEIAEIIEAAGTLEEAMSQQYKEMGHCVDEAWYPYPSKVVFLLDAMDNIPRLRVSAGLMNVFLWLLREAGVKGVPTATAFRKMQASFRKEKGVQTIHCTSSKGNLFSFNSPVDIIANDWSNPQIRPHIHRYPVLVKDGVVSEIWHGEKWQRTLDRHAFSPMYDAGEKHFYVDEIASTEREFVVPLRWLEDHEGSVWAEVRRVFGFDDEAIAFDSDSPKLIKADLLKDNVLVDGEPIYTSFIDVFGDDVSGNRSKSWNKHWNIYMSHRNLPRKLLQQESHVHFISTSQHAGVVEQFQSIKQYIELTNKKPVRVYDPQTSQFIRVKIRCNCGPGDNPAQSEVSGHIGNSGNLRCRKCYVGGTMKEKMTDAGYASMFVPGAPRSALTVLTSVKKATGTKDSYTQYWIDQLTGWSRARQKLPGAPNRIYNPFLTLDYFDATKDTPIEILHTVLLGVVKYCWHSTHTSWKDRSKKVYTVRLQASDSKGLSIPAIQASYIMQYANSLIGRQFKTLSQLNAFHVYDLVNELQYQLVKAVGVLAALLWIPEIHDMEDYLRDVEIAAANVLDIAAAIDPSKVITKGKYHLLAHLSEDIRRFGPVVGVATEGYESFNIIFRHCSILSNHLAPSRDIACQLAKQEIFKHIAAGGWWIENGNELKQAGSGLRQLVEGCDVLQRLFHFQNHRNEKAPGSVTLTPQPLDEKKRRKPRIVYQLEGTAVHGSINGDDAKQLVGNSSGWLSCKSAVAWSTDVCVVGSWVFASRLPDGSEHPTVLTGRIVDILTVQDGDSSLVVIEEFKIAKDLHSTFDMPVLVKRFGETVKTTVRAQDILFDYNVQHDCVTARCQASGEWPAKQERKDSGKTDSFIVHVVDIQRYVINTHAFHNAHLLRTIDGLRLLLKPKLLYPDRQQHHQSSAATLRSSKAAAQLQKEDSAITASSELELDIAGEEPAKKRKRSGDASVEQPAVPNQLAGIPMDVD